METALRQTHRLAVSVSKLKMRHKNTLYFVSNHTTILDY